MQYLHDEQYYSDLYDRGTVEECRRFMSLRVDKIDDVPNFEGTEEERTTLKNTLFTGAVHNVAIEFVKGERYANKNETIRGWMSRDREKDLMLNNAVRPAGVRCERCHSELALESKDLSDDVDGKERVMFILTCTKCQKPHAYWENGDKWEARPNLCEKCSTGMVSMHKREGNIITTTYTCPHCGNTDIDTLDLDEKNPIEPVDLHFEEDRNKYCLTDKEGMNYISGRENLKRATASMKDREENEDAYKAVEQIKTLSLVGLRELLGPVVEQAGYSKLEFGKPDIQRGLTLEFSLEDSTPGREGNDSVYQLQKLLKVTLQVTNWRLMSDGVTNHLGFLTGRLRGYEGKEALLELAKKELGKPAK